MVLTTYLFIVRASCPTLVLFVASVVKKLLANNAAIVRRFAGSHAKQYCSTRCVARSVQPLSIEVTADLHAAGSDSVSKNWASESERPSKRAPRCPRFKPDSRAITHLCSFAAVRRNVVTQHRLETHHAGEDDAELPHVVLGRQLQRRVTSTRYTAPVGHVAGQFRAEVLERTQQAAVTMVVGRVGKLPGRRVLERVAV